MRGRNTVLLALLFLAGFTTVYILHSGPGVFQRLNRQSATGKEIPRTLSKADEYRLRYPDPHNDTVVLPPKEVMQKMDQGALGDLYHKYINSLQIFCRKVIRLGKLDDGGWDFCDDYRFRPRNNCLVYSYGIQFDFSFDDAIVKKYNCEVHSFDPSMRVGDHKHGTNVFFHATGLSGDNNPSRGTGWKMRTLQKQREELGHSKRPLDVLKVDVEEWEWSALPDMIRSGALNDVRQFAIELHITLRIEPDGSKYLLGLSILKDLYDMGFRIFWTHRNLWCKFFPQNGAPQRTGCHERPIDVLKIDIEEYEYLAVPNMLETGILKDIRQMAIEFHVTLKPDRSRRFKEEPPRDKYFFALSLFKDLYDLGFRIFWTHRNPTCKFFSKKGHVERVTCHEVSFVNINNM